jgi:hypothetical protein
MSVLISNKLDLRAIQQNFSSFRRNFTQNKTKGFKTL